MKRAYAKIRTVMRLTDTLSGHFKGGTTAESIAGQKRSSAGEASGWQVLLLSLALDRLFGEPPATLHPVVWLGKLISALEQHAPTSPTSPAARFAYGTTMTLLVCLAAALPAVAIERLLRGLPPILRMFLLGAALKPALAWRSLEDHAFGILAPLENGNLPGAREALSMIVSRDTSTLDEPRIIAATIESVAENLSDSIVAPLAWYAIAGLPGAWLYRATNTLDAMVGYRTSQYEWLGKTAARWDDVMNWVPARLTALAILMAAGSNDDDRRRGWEILQRDGGSTDSPNAGRPMSAMAGTLGVELEKVGHYRLGAGLRSPETDDLRRAIAVMRLAATMAAGLCAVVATRVGRRRDHDRS
jgi:adenosylcobinamide-phosphate synthase